MSSFKDNTGQAWNLAISTNSLRAVKAATGVNLSFQFGENFRALLDDPILIAESCYAIVSEQADKIGLTAEQFYERFVGDVVNDASKALIQALIDFFPKEKRESYAKLPRAVDLHREEERRHAATILAKLEPKQSTTPPGEPSSSSPASSASTPAP